MFKLVRPLVLIIIVWYIIERFILDDVGWSEPVLFLFMAVLFCFLAIAVIRDNPSRQDKINVVVIIVLFVIPGFYFGVASLINLT
ncbi:thiol:disulfide interchange protein [Alkalihalobacillus xiaoxiensis]|uniref:Thiol:disulfide interchange protein n=1 Tax=Shouchella xiaoxiensis TaxID=766895 RepID=A0ABS2SN93_9BACI|nr:hypothetical protein [Shouchella xiaoxiensis]MBM7836983.1 thiol:disulfide interchange protein [Shouchella xiaoxiensis]